MSNNNNKIGLFGATSYVVGNVIGSGIFISPISILHRTNSIGLALVVWLTSGIISLLGAGTSIRRSGAGFAYLCYVGWNSIAFGFMWVNVLLTYPATLAIVIETFGEYTIAAISPIVCIDKINGEHGIYLQKLIGFVMLGALTMVNLMSLRRYASRLQIVFTACKLVAMLVIIIAGLYMLIVRQNVANFDHLFAESRWNAADLILAIYSGLWAYGGADIINFGIEEVENPKRTLPLAMLFGYGIVTVLYLLINVAYFTVLNRAELLDSSSHAIAQQFAIKLFSNLSYAYPPLIGIVLAGNMNGGIFSISRLISAAARRRYLPIPFGMTHVNSDCPQLAVLLVAVLTMAVTFVGNIDQLINYVISLSWLQNCFGIAALLWIRHRHIAVHSESITFNRCVHVGYFLVCFLLVVIPIRERIIDFIIAIAITISGIVVYYLFVMMPQTGIIRVPSIVQRINVVINTCCQKLFMIIVADDENQVQQSSSIQLDIIEIKPSDDKINSTRF